MQNQTNSPAALRARAPKNLSNSQKSPAQINFPHPTSTTNAKLNTYNKDAKTSPPRRYPGPPPSPGDALVTQWSPTTRPEVIKHTRRTPTTHPLANSAMITNSGSL